MASILPMSSISPGLDLSKVPSIHQKRLLTFMNHFIITTVKFLNNFAKTSEKKLMICDQKIQKLEAELCILEAKFNSIPDKDDSATESTEQKPEDVEPDKQLEEDTDAAKESRTDDVQEAESQIGEAGGSSKPEADPKLARYLKMVHFGVPVDAVKLKMQQDGLDPNLLGS